MDSVVRTIRLTTYSGSALFECGLPLNLVQTGSRGDGSLRVDKATIHDPFRRGLTMHPLLHQQNDQDFLAISPRRMLVTGGFLV